MKPWELTLRYAVFAVIATLANLGAQRLVLSGLAGDGIKNHGPDLIIAIGVGTVVGLVVKYVLDKRWIFFDQSTGARAHGERFSRYTATGIFTTAIFWGMESAFWFIWLTDAMRELGAIIGLAIGYVVKFQLDKRFVFAQTPR